MSGSDQGELAVESADRLEEDEGLKNALVQRLACLHTSINQGNRHKNSAGRGGDGSVNQAADRVINRTVISIQTVCTDL